MSDKTPQDGSDGDAGPRRSGGMEDAELKARSLLLGREIASNKKKTRLFGGMYDDEAESKGGYRLAAKVSSEFVAGITVGAILGFGFDRYFETSPWGLIVLLLLGFAAGVLNVLRALGAVAKPPKL